MCARDAPAGMAPDDPADDADLRDRVAQLEATVEKQQATIEQLLPSRRRVLQAGGLVAGGGVLGALTADRASADVVGQVGTSADRVDVFAGAVDANSLNTGITSTSDYEWTDVTSNRSLNTWFQAPSDRDIWVSVIIDVGSSTDRQLVVLDVNTTKSGNAVSRINWNSGGKDSNDQRPFGSTRVPANHYYRVRQIVGSASTIAEFNELK